MDLSLVKYQGNLLGRAIIDNYEKNPEETIKMIKDQFKDNPRSIINTIGTENCKTLGLYQTELEQFRWFFPWESTGGAFNGVNYTFKTLELAVNGLKSAKNTIDYSKFNLDARVYSYKDFHILQIRTI